ncbi:MAG: alpha/beta fold hydrolase [Acidobacteria bacterium]|jgi:pimeloyl-ACP methyl ester carboxylesterase|nr:alpha/beta fold hydrolase [Acidobacteriota bacterium]
MTRHDVATARRLKTVVCVLLALTASACATSRPSGSSQPATAPIATAAGTQNAASRATPVRRTATSKDGIKIAYDMTGTGPFLVMLHGGGQAARSWADRDYVTKLKTRFTLVTPDQRGNGDSDKPATLEAYALDHLLDDVLAVADAAGAERFHVWGFGHGATIARYLAERSDRVISAVLVGSEFGPALSGTVRDAVTGMRAKWLPLVQSKAAGTLEVEALSLSDRTAWDNGVAVSAMALGAMLDYPPLEPAAITVPTLWLVGAADTSAMENAKAYEGKLAGTKVILKSLSGASYTDSFAKSDVPLAEALPFLTEQTTTTQ